MPTGIPSAHDGSVTVAVTRVVKAGHTDAFEEALHRFAHASLELPGQLGLHILRPPADSASRTFGILRTFENGSAYEAFLRSPLFLKWCDEIAPWVEGEPEVRRISGMEAWFTMPGSPPGNGPPKWRLALLTYFAVNLVTTPLLWLAMPALSARVVFPWDNFLFNLPVVALLTWAVMPLLGSVFKKQLHSK